MTKKKTKNRTVQNIKNKKQICSHAVNLLTLQFCKLLLLIINKSDAESLKSPDLMVAYCEKSVIHFCFSPRRNATLLWALICA